MNRIPFDVAPPEPRVIVPGASWVVVLDGAEGKVHQGPVEQFDGRSIVLSPKKGRVAYVVLVRQQDSRNESADLYVDGKVFRSANSFNDLTFSPDGTRLGGSVVEVNLTGTQRHYVFVDDWNSLDYRAAGGGLPGQSLYFSPDSKRFAFVAANGMSSFMIVDREESSGYAEIKNFQFSSDSRRYAFEARYPSGGESVVVVDGKEGAKLRGCCRWMASRCLSMGICTRPRMRWRSRRTAPCGSSLRRTTYCRKSWSLSGSKRM